MDHYNNLIQLLLLSEELTEKIKLLDISRSDISEARDELHKVLKKARMMEPVLSKSQYLESISRRIERIDSSFNGEPRNDLYQRNSQLKLLNIYTMARKVPEDEFYDLVSKYYYETYTDDQYVNSLFIDLLIEYYEMNYNDERHNIKKHFLHDLVKYGNNDNSEYIYLVEETYPYVLYEYLIRKKKFMDQLRTRNKGIKREIWANDQEYPDHIFTMDVSDLTLEYPILS
jgi:hypothetical protein